MHPTARKNPPRRLEFIALPDVPLVRAGDDIAQIALEAVTAAGVRAAPGDVLVIAQKIVSKAEGRQVALSSVEPSPRALDLAAQTRKDPRLVELVLREARAVVRSRPEVLVVEHRLGFILANAGIDASNVGCDGSVLLLPEDPDASCARIRAELRARAHLDIAVMIIDSWGRAWRLGTVGAAIGVAGMAALVDLRGTPDLFGRKLLSTEVAAADELAAGASLAMGQAGEGHPLVLARGFPYPMREGRASELLRPSHLDLFR